jgi:beta-glucanase (GH16 family)
MILFAFASAPATADASRMVRPSSYHHGVFSFDLAGLPPGSIRSGRLLPGLKALPKRKLAAATRRGRLGVRRRAFNPRAPRTLRAHQVDHYRLRLQLQGPGASPDPGHPVGIPGSWRSIFDDEFSGGQLDLARWNPNWFGGPSEVTKPVNSAEEACYRPEHNVLAGGALNQYADRFQDCATKTGQVYQAATGAVTTIDKFNFTYGAAEARIRTSCEPGSWPAWWFNGETWPRDGEMDILESYGDNPDRSTFHYHYAKNGSEYGPGGSVSIPDACHGYHTYAVDWEPGILRWYYDGKLVWQYADGVTSTPHYLVLLLAVKSLDGAQFPMRMQTDYVRVWQH